MDCDFFQFLLHAVATLNVSNAEGKVMILLLKFFQRLLISFDAIFRRETSTALQLKSQKQISRHSAVCLPFIGGNMFLPTAVDQTFSIVVSKCRMSREFCCLFTGSLPENHKF